MIESLSVQSKRSDYNQSTATGRVKVAEVPLWGKVPPRAYKDVYGMGEKVSAGSFTKGLFMNGSAAHNTPLISRNDVTLFPGVFSFDPRMMNFQRELVSELNRQLPVDADADGFTKSGIYTDFDRLLCPAGYYMNPMSYTSVDNKLYREELGLRTDMTKVEEAIAREVWHLVWSQAKVKSVNVAKLSTSGMRRFTHDVQWKLAYAEWLFEPNNFERMLDAVWKDDSLTLANEFEAVYAMYIQKRGQVDKPGKKRVVSDLTYALSGGKKGKNFFADKEVVINGQKWPDFSAIRARVVQAGPWTVNCFLQIPATCTMQALFHDYPSTFHVNTPEEIKRVVDGKYIFCSDVTEYDRSMWHRDIDIQHEVMAEYWDERYVKASQRLYNAPYYSKPLELKGRNGVWVGDPSDWSTSINTGNRSGHAMTSLTAKVQKVIDTLIVINHVYPVVGRCKSFLQGKGPISFVNNGDDEIVCCRTKSDLDSFKKYRADRKVGRYLVEPELGQGFSGQLLCRNSPSDLYYNPKAKVHTTFEKMWVPERSIGGLHRKFWTIGFIDRVRNIMKTDVGREAWEIHMSVYRRTMHDFGDFTSILMREHGRIDLKTDGMTDRDREVLNDPSKLAYKYTPDEIDPVVLKEISSNIPERVVETVVSKYYSGTTK